MSDAGQALQGAPWRFFFQDVYNVAWREVKHFLLQRSRIAISVVQPVIWLVLMGSMMSGLTDNPFAARMLGVSNYRAFMTPGIIVMTSLFGGVYGGVSVIFDRRLGFLAKMYTAPIHRSAIPIGKTVALSLQLVFQAAVIVGLASALGVRFVTGVWGVIVIVLIGALFGSVMGAVSLGLACVVRSHEALFAIVNFLTMPLMFTSNAIFPTAAMPSWLRAISRWNPISYAVGPMRALTVTGWSVPDVVKGVAVLLVAVAVLLAVDVKQFERSAA